MATFIGTKKVSDSEAKKIKNKSKSTTKVYSKDEYKKVESTLNKPKTTTNNKNGVKATKKAATVLKGIGHKDSLNLNVVDSSKSQERRGNTPPPASNGKIFTTTNEALGQSKPDVLVEDKNKPIFTTARKAQGVSKPNNVPDTTFINQPKKPKQQKKPAFKGSGATISATKGNFITDAGKNFAGGATLDSNTLRKLQNPTTTPKEMISILGGYGVGLWAAGSSKVAGGAKYLKGKTGQGLKWAGNIFSKGKTPGKVGTVVKGGATAIGETVVINEASKQASIMTATPEEKKIMTDPKFRQALTYAYQKEEKEIKKQGFVAGFAYDISQGLSSKKGYWETEAYNELYKQGYRGEDLNTAVSAARKFRKGSTRGEVIANLNLARISEKVGRNLAAKWTFGKLTQTAKKKAAGTLGKKVAVAVAPAGAIEGAGVVLNQNLAREQNINTKDMAIYGGAGAVSAAALGGAIAYTSVKGGFWNKAFKVGANVADPFEYGGDKAADAAQFVSKKIKGRTPDTPTVSLSNDVATFSTVRKNRRIKTVTQTDTGGYTITTTPTESQKKIKPKVPVTKSPTYSSTTTETFTDDKKIKTPIDTPTETPTKTPIETPIYTPTETSTTTPSYSMNPKNPAVSVFTPTTTPTFTPTPTTTPTQTNTNINTNIPVLTYTPQPRIPIIPFVGAGAAVGGFFGKSKKGGKNKKKYTPDLVSRTFNIYGKAPKGKLSGLARRPLQGKPGKKKKTSLITFRGVKIGF